MFPGPLGQSLAGDALKRGLWSCETRDIREHGIGRHRAVDDTPAGGGPGMVMRADVLAAASTPPPAEDPRPRLIMSPRGTPFTQARAREWAEGPGLVILCPRFEGVDERFIHARRLTEVRSATMCCRAARSPRLTILDACVRLIPGVMGKVESGDGESFEGGLLEYPAVHPPARMGGARDPDDLCCRATTRRSPGGGARSRS